MATIKFFIQSNKSPAGIYVRLREGRQIDAKAKTKFIIRIEDWSPKKARPINLKSESLKKLKCDLDQFSIDLQNHYNSSVGKIDINSQWLKDFINPPITEESIPNKLTDYFDYYVNRKNHIIDKDSVRKYRNIKTVLIDFQKYSKRVFLVKDVNEHFRSRFVEFALEVGNYSKGTVARMIKFIKTVCYHAERSQVEVSPELRGLKPIREENNPVIYLNLDEIELIESTVLKQENLIVARDWLLISIETGQRISDFINFSKEKIRSERGIVLLEFKQKKTNTNISLPLSKRIKNILEKYDGNFPPKMSEGDYNLFIKDVCQIAGLINIIEGGKNDKDINRKIRGAYKKYELVCSHIGRRSFATNNFGRVPTPVIMSITGHKSESTFLKYIGKTPTEMSHLMAEYINI
jgi:integrase